MTSFFTWLAAAGWLLGAAALGGRCQRPAARYAPGRVLSLRRPVMMDTITAVLHGQVRSRCQAAALPATVQLAGAGRSFRTAANKRGQFQFMHVPAGTYRLAATCPGYGALADTLVYLGSGHGAEVAIGLGCRVAAGR